MSDPLERERAAVANPFAGFTAAQLRAAIRYMLPAGMSDDLQDAIDDALEEFDALIDAAKAQGRREAECGKISEAATCQRPAPRHTGG